MDKRIRRHFVAAAAFFCKSLLGHRVRCVLFCGCGHVLFWSARGSDRRSTSLLRVYSVFILSRSCARLILAIICARFTLDQPVLRQHMQKVLYTAVKYLEVPHNVHYIVCFLRLEGTFFELTVTR